MDAPEFHLEVPVGDMQSGDVVFFRSDRGGYRIGILSRRMQRTCMIDISRSGGVLGDRFRSRGESVPIANVAQAFRDTTRDALKMKEKVC